MSKMLSISTLALGLCGAMAAHAVVPAQLLGDPANPGDATRVITITPTTQWVNVTEGETVAFKTGSQAFAFKFDGPRSSFNLQWVAPAGMLDHRVVAYVAPDEDGGRGRGGHGR